MSRARPLTESQHQLDRIRRFLDGLGSARYHEQIPRWQRPGVRDADRIDSADRLDAGDWWPAAVGGARTFDLPFTEWGLQRWKEYDPVNKGDYAGSCLPFGLSRLINSPHGLQIVQSSDAFALLFEQNTWHHWVPTNGMKWPADLPLTWSGLSIGHWEGDTLIVETRGFNGYTWLDTVGHPHSKELVLTNTFRRTDAETIVHTVTVRDPKTYMRDWMNERIWKLRGYPDVLMEYSCEENNLDNLLNGTIKRWTPPEDEE